MVILKAVKEVGTSGGEFHLAKAKRVEVSEDEAERLMKEYPGCLVRVVEPGQQGAKDGQPAAKAEIIENEVKDG